MPSSASERNTWIVLEDRYSAPDALSYIGRIVVDPARPGSNFVPDIDRTSTSSDQVPLRRVQQLESVKPFLLKVVVGKSPDEGILATVEKTVSGRIKIPVIIGAGAKKVEEVKWAMRSNRIKSFGLEQHQQVFEAVQTVFGTSIDHFIKKHGNKGPYYLMVGLKTALNPAYSDKAFTETSGDAQGKLPVAETTTATTAVPVPLSVNPELNIEYKETTTSAVNESVNGEVAFVAQYVELDIDEAGLLRVFERKGTKKKLRSKGLKHFRGETLAFGSDSEDEDEDEDDEEGEEEDNL
ncbi:hypothetical protein BDV96DRAFT_581937, partial [Lophiotrema nucula]